MGDDTLLVTLLAVRSVLMILYMTRTTVLLLPQVVGWVVSMVAVVMVLVSTVGMMIGSCLAILDHDIVVATQWSDERRNLAMALVGNIIGMLLIVSLGMRYDRWLHPRWGSWVDSIVPIHWIDLPMYLLSCVSADTILPRSSSKLRRIHVCL